MNEIQCTQYDECRRKAAVICDVCGKSFCQPHTFNVVKQVIKRESSSQGEEEKSSGTAVSWVWNSMTIAKNADESEHNQTYCLDCYGEYLNQMEREHPEKKNRVAQMRAKVIDIRQQLHPDSVEDEDEMPRYQHVPQQAAQEMQEKLSKIPWELLQHAYGSAQDTPFHLLGLLSTDEEERQRAWYHLYASICHQGSVYEASCAAIPFFIHLLEQVPEDQKLDILSFLTDLAHRDWYANRDQHILRVDHDFESATSNRHQWWSIGEFLQEGNQFHEPQWMVLAHRQVGEGMPIYLKSLQTTDQKLLVAVLYLISGFRELNELLVPTIEPLYSTTADPLLQAAILLCLSTLLDENSPVWQHYLSVAIADSEQVHSLVRFASAFSLATCHSALASLEVVDVLVDEILNPDHLERGMLCELPWDIRVHSGVCAAISGLGVPLGVQGLVMALERGASQWRFLDAIRVAEALLDIAFFGDWVNGRYWSIAIKEKDRSERWASLNRFGESYYNYGHSFYREGGTRFFGGSGDALIECRGYDEYEAEQLQRRFEREGSQALSDAQRQAVEAVLWCRQLWQVESDFLKMYGLPTKREQLEQFLAVAPLDR
jgi:hypothetical protein